MKDAILEKLVHEERHVCPRTVFSVSWHYQFQVILLVNYKADIIIISSNVTNYRHDITEKLLIWH